MNIRPVISVVFALAYSCGLFGQQMVDSRNGQMVGGAGESSKQEIERRIGRMEDTARKSEASGASDLELGKIYEQLGLLYEDAAQWARSESAVKHAVALLRRDEASKKELAKALSELGNLHVVMGKLRESEKEDQEALRLGVELGDKLQIAHSWDDLAALSLARHKYEQAKDFARQAVAEFVTNEGPEAFDGISARYTLALAYCHLKDYASAIPLLTSAVDEARARMRGQHLPIGFGEFLLGYALWKSGDPSSASGHLEEGVAGMREQLGWGHPVYLTVLGYYSQFLRETRQLEAAKDVERQIRRASAVVDVRSLDTRGVVSGFDGLR
jgi:tetratricopeptide (TPR) repeat protein